MPGGKDYHASVLAFFQLPGDWKTCSPLPYHNTFQAKEEVGWLLDLTCFTAYLKKKTRDTLYAAAIESCQLRVFFQGQEGRISINANESAAGGFLPAGTSSATRGAKTDVAVTTAQMASGPPC